MAPLLASIGAWLRLCHEHLELSQEHLGARLELENVSISRTQYSRLENGEPLPNAAHLITLRKVLGVSYEWLLEGDRETGRRGEGKTG